jgi:integrase
MSAEDYQRAADLDPVIGSTVPAGRELTPGELQAIKQACRNDPSPAGARDNGLIGVAYSCGLRRAELAGLDLESYEPEAGRLLVLGKRSKERYVPVNQGLALALGEWLAIRGSFPGALFWPVNKAGKLTPRRLTPQAIYLIMARRAAEAGVAKFSPHDLRRTCAGDLLARGGDTLIVARFLGHSDPKTTARYDLRPWEAVRKAGELLHW